MQESKVAFGLVDAVGGSSDRHDEERGEEHGDEEESDTPNDSHKGDAAQNKDDSNQRGDQDFEQRVVASVGAP